MTDNKPVPIYRSPILNHPLGGRTGLLRELGIPQKDGGAVWDAWAKSLGRRLLWPFQVEFEDLFSEFSSFIYDEVSQGILGAMKIPGAGRDLVKM